MDDEEEDEAERQRFRSRNQQRRRSRNYNNPNDDFIPDLIPESDQPLGSLTTVTTSSKEEGTHTGMYMMSRGCNENIIRMMLSRITPLIISSQKERRRAEI